MESNNEGLANPYEQLQKVRSIERIIEALKAKLERKKKKFEKKIEEYPEGKRTLAIRKWAKFEEKKLNELKELEGSKEQILQELENIGISPEIQERLREESRERLIKFLAYYRSARREQKMTQELASDFIGDDDEFANFLEEENNEIDNPIKNKAYESPEAFLAFHLLKLREYKRSLEKGELVITPWVESKIKEIRRFLSMGRPVFLYGETGTGKTEVAKLIGQNYSNGYEIVRGHRFMTKEDLFGYLGLKATEPPPPEEVPALIEKAMQRIKENHPDMNDKELKYDKRIIENVIIGQASDPVTVTEFFKGPVYRAITEGKLLIIDEANYIPPGLLASLNEILSKAILGSEIEIPELNKTVKIKEGFGVIFTGNINIGERKKYLERFPLDPALKDRVKLIEYNTPPQEYRPEIGPYDQLETGAIPDRDLFLIAVATLIDRKGNLILPGGEAGLERVWHLCQAFKLFQDIFAGKPVEEEYQFKQMGRPLSLTITQNNLSMRKLVNILTRWKQEGFSRSLDYYVWDEVIAQALSTPQEAAYFYQIFQTIYGFFQDGKIWDQNPSYGSRGEIRFDYHHPGPIDQEIPPLQRNLLPVNVIQLAEAVSGEKIPEIEIVIDEEKEELTKIALEQAEKKFLTLEEQFENLFKELKEYCPPEEYPTTDQNAEE